MIKIKLEERHLDLAIEARKNTPPDRYCNTGSCFVAQAAQEQAEFKAIHDPEVRQELDWSIHLDLADATGDYSYLATVGGQDAR